MENTDHHRLAPARWAQSLPRSKRSGEPRNTVTEEAHSGHGQAFDAWFDAFLDEYLQRQPVNATFLGAHGYDDVLPDYSPDGDAALAANARTLIRKLDAIPNEGLTEAQLYDRILARGFLEIRLWNTESPHFRAGNPAQHTSEALGSVIALLQRDDDPQQERVEAAISRMSALPGFLATARQRVASAPLVWTERAIREADAGAAYFGDGLKTLAEERHIERPDFRTQAEVAAEAFRAHAAWLRSQLAERRTPFQPAGTAAFDRLLHQGHVLPVAQTTDWWFEYARAELVETTAERKELARTRDWRRSWREQLAEIPRHHPAAGRYEQTFGEVWTACRQRAINAGLVTWPESPIGIAPIPRSDRAASQWHAYPAYRGAGPFGGERLARLFVPPLDTKSSPAVQVALLRNVNDVQIKLEQVIRRGGLGQHVQNTGALKAESRAGRMAGVRCATGIGMFCGGTLVDGWAHYATELMEEIGALTPLEQLAEAQTRVRIAARAVADAAIHSGEFSLERAARFLRDEAAMPASTALDEAVTISMFPGTGMAALAGVAGIDELRRAMEEREGPEFSLRAFHDCLLSYGAIPVTLIAASMLKA